MSGKVSFTILRLSRLMSVCGVPWRSYCNALKPQIETAINCCDVMRKNEPYLHELDNKINSVKINRDVNLALSSDLLNEPYQDEFSLPKFVKILKVIKVQLLQNDTSISLETDSRFIKLCGLFETNCHKCSPFLLTSALRSLLALNIGTHNSTVEAIGKVIVQKIDKFDGNDMVECLMVLNQMNDITDTQRDIINTMLNEIPKKLHDLHSGSSVFKLIRLYDRFDRKNTRRLDFKLAELVKDFSPHYLCKLLCLLAEKQSRNKALLKAISYSIQDCDVKPSLKQTVDILYALNSLNFPDSSLLLHLTDDRTSEICVEEQPSLIASLLTACGHLRWHHKDVMEACGKWILNNFDKCSSREFVAYVLTAATLNYTSSDVIKHLLPCFKEEKITPSTVWLDVVWSLAILGCVDKEMLLGVLMKDFYEPLLDGDDFRITSNKLKLMNLKSVLKNRYPEHVFSCDLFLDSVEVPKSHEVENSRKSVVNALSNFILPEKYMYTNLSIDMGISIDAEFIMDDKGKPFPLAEYGSNLKSPTLIKELPPGVTRFRVPYTEERTKSKAISGRNKDVYSWNKNVKLNKRKVARKTKVRSLHNVGHVDVSCVKKTRVAVLVLTHKDFTLNEPHVTGIISLTTELLKSQGYAVVQIPYSEFSENITTVKKVHYVQKKIMSTIKSNSGEKIM